jgi:anaerobic selenocysteine-containing dehydrogenase
LIKRLKTNADFIDRHVSGFGAFREMVEDFTPQKAAAICGLETSQIEQLAAWIGDINPLTINAGYGMQRIEKHDR